MTPDEFKYLQPGDIVIANTTSGGRSYVCGCEYIVKSVNVTSISTVKDSCGSVTNGWHHKYFDIGRKRKIEDFI